MSKPAFTPAGVNQKQDELYALTDPELFLEADAIEADTPSWIRANFTLTSPQDTYLSGMNADALKYYGQQCALCFRHRLPITLIYPAPPAPGYAKLTDEENKVIVRTDGSGTLEVTGSLTFTMVYELP